MGQFEREKFLDHLMAERGHEYGVIYRGPDPEETDAVRSLLKQAEISGATAVGGEQKAPDAKYNYMQMGNQVHWASDKNKFFTVPVAKFFVELFHQAARLSEHELSKTDLWHGHFVASRGHGNCILFHAKECPNDIEPQHNASFSSQIEQMRYRNVMWVSDSNRIYVIDAGYYDYLRKPKLVQSSPFFEHYVMDTAKEVAGWTGEADPDPGVLRARKLEEGELGANRFDVYYLVDEPKNAQPEALIAMVSRDALCK